MAELIPPGSDTPIMQVPHSFLGAARSSTVVVQPHPFTVSAHSVTLAEGVTLREIVEGAALPAAYHGFVRVWVDDVEVPRDRWHVTRPKAGRTVYVRVTPQGGGRGKNILATVLMLVVTVAAAVFAPMLAGTFGLIEGTTAFKIASGLIGAGISMVGALAVNALVPPPSQSDSGLLSQRALLSGVRNQFRPYAEIPRIFGKRRVYPLQASRPYTEVKGDDRYLRVLLCVGWGPLKITNVKIGETPIENFENIRYQVREGWASGHASFGTVPAGKLPEARQTLFTRTVNEDSFSILVEDAGRTPDRDALIQAELDAWIAAQSNYPSSAQIASKRAQIEDTIPATVDDFGPEVIRTTETDTDEFSIDLTASYGLAKFTDEGDTDEVTIEVYVDWRAVGDTTWTPADWEGKFEADGTQTAGRIILKDDSRTPVSRGGRVELPAPGQYEIRLRRRTKLLTPERKYAQRIEWTALRSIKYETPVQMPGIAMIALRMKATDQFNGLPDTINCEVESYLPAYDGTSWEWGISRSPAWAYADLMRRRGVERMIKDKRIDLTSIRNWATACAANAPNGDPNYWEFSGIFEGGSIFTCLRQVAGHGRASFCIRDGKYSVVRDVPQTVPVQHITPRNSFRYSGSKAFIDRPHALKMQFVNEERGYQEDEVIVYDDGFDESNATRFETVDLPGCTRSGQAWREGRYHLAVSKLRPEEHVVYQDIENLRCTLGDYVVLAHDVLSIGIGSGRIAARVIGKNLLSYTGTLTNAAWQGYWQKPTLTSGEIAPDGSATAWSWNASATTGGPDGLRGGLLQSAPAGDAGKTVTVSAWLKASAPVSMTFGVSDGAGNSGTINLTTEWQYFTYTGTVNPAGPRYFQLFEVTNANVTISIWRPQAEFGTQATSFYSCPAASNYGLVVGFDLDAEVPKEEGTSYVLRVRMADGQSALLPLTVSSEDANVDRVRLTTPLAASAAPVAGDLFIYGEAERESAPMLVKKIEPGPDLTAKLTLVDAQPGVWTADTDEIPDFNTYVSDDTPVDAKRPPKPSFTVQSDEAVIERQTDGRLKDRIAVTLRGSAPSKFDVRGWEVQFKRSKASKWVQAATNGLSITRAFCEPVVAGVPYDIRARYVTRLGEVSDWEVVTQHTVIGKTTAPSAVTGFVGVAGVAGVQLNWNANPELDVRGYQIRRGQTWDDAEVVNAKVVGTSFFAALSVAGAQQFLIRAIDAIGLMSEEAAAITVSLIAPGNVRRFEATMQGDRVRFNWSRVAGEGVEYEVRAGASWVNGRRLFRSASNTMTIQLPIKLGTSPRFWIKARSAAGLYSPTARFANGISTAEVSGSIAQNAKQNTNAIIDQNIRDSNFPGTLFFASVSGSGASATLSNTLISTGKYSQFGCYTYPIALPARYAARNWLDFSYSVAIGASPTWDQVTDGWAELAAQTWTGTVVDDAESGVEAYFSRRWNGTAPSDIVEAFGLNSSLIGLASGTAATLTGTASYLSVLNYNGFNTLTQTGKVKWDFAIPAEFSIAVDLRQIIEREHYGLYMFGIPSDRYTTSFRQILMTVGAGSYQLRLYYNGDENAFVLEDSSSNQVKVTAPDAFFSRHDVLTLTISQSATGRSLCLSSKLKNTLAEEVYASEPFGPLGAFTFLALYGTTVSWPLVAGAMSDLIVFNRAFDEEEHRAFHDNRMPAGYYPWQEFVPGDYDYQNGLLQLRFSTEAVDHVVSVSEAELHIDVPDLIETGRLTVPVGGATYTFTRRFTVAPEVTVTQVGGTTTAIPRITSGPTTGSFTVKLYNAASPTTEVAGTVSFTASGY